MRALVFPGQGAETPGMGVARAERDPTAARLLARAGEIVGVDARAVLARGGPALRRQDVLQALTLAVSLGSVAHLGRVERYAGHSLGELAAAVVSGAVDPDDALHFVAARGRAMDVVAREIPGGIVAVRGTEAEVEGWLAAVEGLAVAARNSPTAWALCGPTAALRALGAHTRVTPVTNAGAWHHPMLEAAAPAVRAAAALLPVRTPSGLLSAHVAGPLTAAGLRALLPAHVYTPVDWLGVVGRLAAEGVEEVYVAEPARHLAALVRECVPTLRVLPAEAVA